MKPYTWHKFRGYEQLAGTLVRDWFYLQMHKATYPNIAPQPPLWDMQMPEGDDE